MRASDDQIYVKSHVARDLLQSAGLFKTDKLVVWEYVSNSLQYVDSGINPVVKVTLDQKSKRMAIEDNGRGMDWKGLHNFFVMHGENLDRKRGQPGRGRFGTGKSAAFGIANLLRITTVRNGKRSRVELNRSEVQNISSEEPIPVKILEKEVLTDAKNGTLVEIEGIHLKSLDQPGIIRYIERHLAKWPRNATVFVNNHECEIFEPPLLSEERLKPEGSLRDILGEVELTLKVSMAPLEEDLRGVSVYSNGVWYETTLAGSEGRDMAQYIFGEIDVPRLDEDKSPIAPFDVSRSMRLNPNNELVRTLYAFVGQNVEVLRRKLVEKEKKRKSEEEAQRLSEQASEIARLINEDFETFQQRVAKAKAKASGYVDPYRIEREENEQGDDLLFGSEVPARVISETGGPGSTNSGGHQGTEPRNLGPRVAPAPPNEDKKGHPVGSKDQKTRPRGGFMVEFKNMGEESPRAQYLSAERTIYINLDHPQLVAARGKGTIEELTFRRLAYEVAFAEYSIALAVELAARGEFFEPSDAIVEIRETLNRVARKSAKLYSAE